jgi:uncharacterized protein YbjT (DUF2867 family)
MGRSLIPRLLQRGHKVTALARPGSEGKVPAGCEVVAGDALDGSSYVERLKAGETFVQLVGVSHPGPGKAAQFEAIDRKSGMEAIRAAKQAGIGHFIYVSVAHPAPTMHAYIAARSACEDEIRAQGLNATILRPWYVLGPGHRWPCALIPLYWLAEKIPSTRDGARRLGLVTLAQMTDALVHAIERPVEKIRIVEVPEIRVSNR